MRLGKVCVAWLVLLLLGGCEARQHEEAARLAVRSLVAAPPEAVKQELRKVVALGRYALPDIEQEFHSFHRGKRLLFYPGRVLQIAALALKQGVTVREVDMAALRKQLIAQNVILPEAYPEKYKKMESNRNAVFEVPFFGEWQIPKDGEKNNQIKSEN